MGKVNMSKADCLNKAEKTALYKDRFAQDLFQTGKEPNFMDNADPDGETNFLNSNHNTKWTESVLCWRKL